MTRYLTNILEFSPLLAAMFSFITMALLAFIPAMPIPLVAGFIGHYFSFPVALTINLIGNVVGSLCMYYLSKNMLMNFAIRYTNKWKKLQGFFNLLERNGFLAVLVGRLIPIMPSAAINLIAGLSNIAFLPFLLATILGKFPTMLGATFAGNNFEEHQFVTLSLALLYCVILILLGYKLKKKWTTH